MKIALIDNDFVSRYNHNFPNLALMKLSTFHKQKGHEVELIGFNEINPNTLFSNDYDKIYVSKAFTDSFTPDYVFKIKNVKFGGTGFYFDKALPLDYEIEHSKPDYGLYNKVLYTIKKKDFFTDYSIGFTTRGCFRHCPFCVNKNSNKVELHSPVDEFYDPTKKKLAMLDDNILGLSNKDLYKIFDRFLEINKPITYRQGIDIRLMTIERAQKLFQLKYDGMYYFAFDLWKNKDIIEPKMKLFHDEYMNKSIKKDINFIQTKVYLFCGFDENNVYSDSFFEQDLIILFKRIEICLRYKMIPYVMRYEKSYKTKYEKIYLNIINHTNNIYMTLTKMSFIEYFEKNKFKYSLDFFSKKTEFKKYLELKL
jgi:hypothetical protein